MARTVEDVAVSLQCLAGRDGLDPRQADVPASLPAYTDALSRGVKGLRIGVLDEGFGVPGGDRAVDEAVMEAVHALERAGARVERVSVPLHTKALPALLPIYLEGGKRMYDTNFGGSFAKSYYPSSLISIFGRLKQSHAREFSPNLKLNLLQGYYLQRNYGGRLYAKAPERAADVRGPVRPRLRRRGRAGHAHDSHDRAALARPARLRGRARADHAGRHAEPRPGPGDRQHVSVQLHGHPAISVPCAKLDGMPVGLMLVAPYFREDALLQAAAAYQQSVDWATLLATPAPRGA
jgi:amidase